MGLRTQSLQGTSSVTAGQAGDSVLVSWTSKMRFSELNISLMARTGAWALVPTQTPNCPCQPYGLRFPWTTWVHVGDLEPVGECWFVEGLKPLVFHYRRKTEVGGGLWELMDSLGSSFWTGPQ